MHRLRVIASSLLLTVLICFLARAEPRSLPSESSDLLRHWVHSSEEEPPDGNVRIYRPAGFKTFPPSRFRMAYTFASGGACQYYDLSPDDAHRFEPCTWSIREGDPPILQIRADQTTTSFRIVELSATVLRLEPLQ